MTGGGESRSVGVVELSADRELLDWVLLNDVEFGGDCETNGVGVVGEGDGSGTRDIWGERIDDALAVGEPGRDGCFIALRRGGTSEADILLYA